MTAGDADEPTSTVTGHGPYRPWDDPAAARRRRDTESAQIREPEEPGAHPGL